MSQSRQMSELYGSLAGTFWKKKADEGCAPKPFQSPFSIICPLEITLYCCLSDTSPTRVRTYLTSVLKRWRAGGRGGAGRLTWWQVFCFSKTQQTVWSQEKAAEIVWRSLLLDDETLERDVTVAGPRICARPVVRRRQARPLSTSRVRFPRLFCLFWTVSNLMYEQCDCQPLQETSSCLFRDQAHSDFGITLLQNAY